MPRMYSSSGGGPADNPGGPADPNTGTGHNTTFHGPHGPGKNIPDPSNPSHLHLKNSNQVRLNRAQKGMINPAAPHVKQPRPKAAAATKAPRSAGGHSVTKTSTRMVNGHGTIVGISAGGQSGAIRLGSLPFALFAHFLEQTVVVAVNGEPVGINSFGQFFPFGHKPTKSGKLLPSAALGIQEVGSQQRANLVAYDPPSRTATVAYANQPDAPTFSVPVAASVTDAQMAAASSVGLVAFSDTDPTDAVINWTI